MSFEQVHNAQLAIISELQNLQNVINAFYKLVERLIDENHATNVIHKDLMSIVRSASEFMAQTPDLLNTIIDMLTTEKISFEDNTNDIGELRKDIAFIREFIEKHNEVK